MKSYRPTIRSLQEDWARRISRQIMRRRRKPVPPSKITDNSVPWVENPRTVADFLEISRRVEESKNLWLNRFQGSSNS